MLRSSLVFPSLLSLVLALSLSAADFQFDATGVTANVTPYATAYWACACAGSYSGYPLYAYRQAIVEDINGDGIVRWDQGDDMLGGVYTMIDGTSRSITTRRSDSGLEVDPGAFPAKAFLRDETGAYTRFAMNEVGPFSGADWIYYFWVRPGVGAWQIIVPVDGSRDELPATFRTVMYDVRTMSPVGDSPSVPAGIEPGDLFVLYDYHLRFWAGSLVDTHLGESVGGGVILHAKTAGHEDDEKMTITLARVEGTDGAASVHYETADDTAKAGVHYQSSSGTAVFPPGHIFSMFDVPVIDDTTDAGGVRFNVKLSEPSGATIGSPSFSVAIPDNDDTPHVMLETLSIPEGDGGPREVPMKVSLNHTAPKPVTLHWEVQDRFWNQKLQEGVLEFAVGEQQKSIAIHYVADDIYGLQKFWRIVITDAVNALWSREGRLTIVEDDPPPTITVSGATVSESAGNAIVTVKLSEALTFGFGALYFTEEESATSPADYTGTPENLVPIEAGSTTATITIPIHDDSLVEGTESFRVYVYPIGGGDALPATVTILDDDVPDPSVTIDHVTVNEGDGGVKNLPVPVMLSHAAPKPVTLKWKAYDLATLDTVDTGTLHFAAGERAGSLSLRYVADDLWGPDQSLGIVITEATNASAAAEGRVTIVDDELPPAITAAAVVVRESDDVAVVDVSLSAPVSVSLRGVYETVDGTAKVLDDFRFTRNDFVIPAGSTAFTIVIPIIDDAAREEPESFTVVVDAAPLTTTPLTATVTILDDDGPGRRRSMRR